MMQLYGEKETELVERGRIISSYPKELIENFRRGAKRGVVATTNQSLPHLRNKEIEILEKVAGSNGVELIFNAGESAGIRTGTFLSIVTEYGNELWGIVRIIWPRFCELNLDNMVKM